MSPGCQQAGTCEGRAPAYNGPVLQVLCSKTVFTKAILSGWMPYTKPVGIASSAETAFIFCRKARQKPGRAPRPGQDLEMGPGGTPQGSAASEVVAFSGTGLSRPQCPPRWSASSQGPTVASGHCPLPKSEEGVPSPTDASLAEPRARSLVTRATVNQRTHEVLRGPVLAAGLTGAWPPAGWDRGGCDPPALYKQGR